MNGYEVGARLELLKRERKSMKCKDGNVRKRPMYSGPLSKTGRGLACQGRRATLSNGLFKVAHGCALANDGA